MVARANGRALALIPVGVGVLLAALLFPHDAPPGDVPVPLVDERAVLAAERTDDTLAKRAATTPLPGETRALGEAIRTFNTAEAESAPDAHWAEIRTHIDSARALALDKNGLASLVALRAAQLSRFLAELGQWRKTGRESLELKAEGGGFLRRMTLEGWAHDRTLLLSDREVRALFKLKWNAVAQLEHAPGLDLTRDEWLVLYRFYLLHPHASEGARESFAAARRNARSPADCDALAAGEAIATEQWRLEKIDALAKIAPEYPAAYARGVALFRAAKYEASVAAFQEWLTGHPEGPLSLRARNYLHVAVVRTR